LAARIALRRRGLPSGSPPPAFAATVISLIRRVKILPRLASSAPFLCLIVAHFEWPDMRDLSADNSTLARDTDKSGTPNPNEYSTHRYKSPKPLITMTNILRIDRFEEPEWAFRECMVKTTFASRTSEFTRQGLCELAGSPDPFQNSIHNGCPSTRPHRRDL